VVGGDLLVVHVRDVHHHGLAGALGWLVTLDLKAGAAAEAILEDGEVAARTLAVEGGLVHILVPARTTVVVGAGARRLVQSTR